MRIFIICSVRDTSKEYQVFLEKYAKELEEAGHIVHLPHRDTNQKNTSLGICTQNATAIYNADEVHIHYNENSKGTHFDMGVAFGLGKPIKLINDIYPKNNKSFYNLLLEWNELGIPISPMFWESYKK